jgi:hypothetical protein
MLSHLNDTMADSLYVTKVSHHRLAQTNIQTLPGDPVFQAVKPGRECIGAFDRIHDLTVIVWLHLIKLLVGSENLRLHRNMKFPIRSNPFVPISEFVRRRRSDS